MGCVIGSSPIEPEARGDIDHIYQHIKYLSLYDMESMKIFIQHIPPDKMSKIIAHAETLLHTWEYAFDANEFIQCMFEAMTDEQTMKFYEDSWARVARS